MASEEEKAIFRRNSGEPEEEWDGCEEILGYTYETMFGKPSNVYTNAAHLLEAANLPDPTGEIAKQVEGLRYRERILLNDNRLIVVTVMVYLST